MGIEYLFDNLPIIILSIITAIFVILIYKILKEQGKTREKILEEQEKGRKEGLKPKISAKPYFTNNPRAMDIKIVNIGRGPALEVNAICETEPKSVTTTWYTKFLEPTESQRIRLKEQEPKEIFKKYKKITVSAYYQDIYGQPFDEENVIDVKKIKESMKNEHIIHEKDLNRKMDDVIENLDSINKGLNKIDDVTKNLKSIDIGLNHMVRGLGPIIKKIKK